MPMLEVALEPAAVIVAVDPGKVVNRVWVSNGGGLLEDPVSLPVSREGIGRLERLLRAHTGPERPVIAIEATGSLHRSWAIELERLHPGAVRLFAPSETKAARMQLGSGRFKTDDRDCAALTYLARQGAGRRRSEEVAVDALRTAVRHRRGLVADRKVAQQRLHDQLNALCPGLSAPAGHGRSLSIETPTGQAVLACAAAFAGRAPATRSLIVRAPGRLTKATAEYWVHRWRGCLPPPADAEPRARRLARDLERYRILRADIAVLDDEIAVLLGATDGQILTSLPRGGDRAGRDVRCAQPAYQPVPGRRPPLFRHGPCPGALRVGDRASPWKDLAPGPGRAPRRTHGHRLGSVALLAELRPTRRRTPCPRHETDPGSRRHRSERLPPGLPAAGYPTTLR